MSEIFQEPSAEQRTLQPLANKNRQRKKNDSTNYLLCVAKFAVIWYKIGKHMLFLFYVFLVLFQFVSKCGCYVCPMFPMFYFYQTQWKPNFFNIILQPHHLYMGVLEGVFAGVPCWAEGLNIYIYIWRGHHKVHVNLSCAQCVSPFFNDQQPFVVFWSAVTRPWWTLGMIIALKMPTVYTLNLCCCVG